MAGYERNLVLVHTQNLQARSDFETIREKLAERATEIEVFIVNNDIPNSVTRREAARRPAVVFSPVPLRQFVPQRGRVYAGCVYSKMEQVERLAAAARRVPEAVMITPATRLDEKVWGAFTVVKPNRGRQGGGVSLRRTRDVCWVDPQSWPRDDARCGEELLAQKFVDTGPLATSYRVMTVFGRAVYSAKSRQKHSPQVDMATLDERQSFHMPIASNSGDRTLALNYEPDILAFGSNVAGVFPEAPALGVDIIRDHASGALYVLEVNASGLVWHISSGYGLVMQHKYGVDFQGQFGALDIIADALIDVARREAE